MQASARRRAENSATMGAAVLGVRKLHDRDARAHDKDCKPLHLDTRVAKYSPGREYGFQEQELFGRSPGHR